MSSNKKEPFYLQAAAETSTSGYFKWYIKHTSFCHSFFNGSTPLVGLELFIVEVLRSQYNTPQSVDCVWNVMAHVQKPDCLSAKQTSPFKLAGASVQSTTGSRGVDISGSNAGYTMLWGSMKGSGYPLHSPVSPSLPLTCITVCHHISTGLLSLLWPIAET
jgi:hypothetical protein